jgi:hypothetical protein
MTDQQLPGETPTQPTTETGTAPAAQTPASETPADVQVLIDRAVAEATKKANAEAAKYRKQAEAAEAAERARQEAALSETEKLQRRAAELEVENKRLQSERLRIDAAGKHGLPAELASRLQGETPEELEADAAKLAALLPKPAPPAGPRVSPTNPGGALQGESEAERRARIYQSGSGASVFTPEWNVKRGGGVIHPDKGD